MGRMALAAALATLPLHAWAGDASWGAYRSVLATCIRHVQCESDACLAATRCDPARLTWADRNWIDGNPEAIHDLPATPAEIAKSRVAAQVDGEIASEDHGLRLDVEKYVFAGPQSGKQAGIHDPGAPNQGPLDDGELQTGPASPVTPVGPPRGQPSAWDPGDDGQAYGGVSIDPSPASIGIRRRPAYEHVGVIGGHPRPMPVVRVREGAMEGSRSGIVVQGRRGYARDDRPDKS